MWSLECRWCFDFIYLRKIKCVYNKPSFNHKNRFIINVVGDIVCSASHCGKIIRQTTHYAMLLYGMLCLCIHHPSNTSIIPQSINVYNTFWLCMRYESVSKLIFFRFNWILFIWIINAARECIWMSVILPLHLNKLGNYL